MNGTAFSQACKVTVDGNDCPVVSATYFVLTCLVPANVIVYLHSLKAINHF